MGGDLLIRVLLVASDGFNPRPRMGGDLVVHLAKSKRPVSIHAPAWGATEIIKLHLYLAAMFQSTPPHGGRLSCHHSLSRQHLSFNPRPRMGGDKQFAHDKVIDIVSIHAPAWGAT